MAWKTIFCLAAFVFACGGALYAPMVGVVAYVIHYQVGPESQWWGVPIAEMGVRFSLVLATFTMAGVVIQRRTLRWGSAILMGQEWMMIAFLGLVWVSYAFFPTEQSAYPGDDIPPLKLTKIIAFVLIITHVVTSRRRLDVFMWAIVAGTLFLGYQAYTASTAAFTADARLNRIGGPDFRESNDLAAYLAASLPIIGVQFLRSGWAGKMVCAVAGVLTVNGIVLTRSRGAAVALLAGTLGAMMMAPGRHRKIVALGVVAAGVGGYYLADPGFWKRAETISATEEQRDRSAQSRIELWKGSFALLAEHPLGVGAGNFRTAIGRYLEAHAGRDAHNTYVLCWSELGIQGIALYLVILSNALLLIYRAQRESEQLPEGEREGARWTGFAMATSLLIYAVSGMTLSRLYAEANWWFLALPVCLWRAVNNAQAEGVMRTALGTKRLVGGQRLPSKDRYCA